MGVRAQKEPCPILMSGNPHFGRQQALTFLEDKLYTATQRTSTPQKQTKKKKHMVSSHFSQGCHTGRPRCAGHLMWKSKQHPPPRRPHHTPSAIFSSAHPRSTTSRRCARSVASDGEVFGRFTRTCLFGLKPSRKDSVPKLAASQE